MSKTIPALILCFMISGAAAGEVPLKKHDKYDSIVDEVALVVKGQRISVFSAISNHWFNKDLQIRETILERATGGRVVVIVTNARILGFSALTGGWSEEGLRLDETLDRLEVNGNVGTVVTNSRALSFNARTGRWIEMAFPIY